MRVGTEQAAADRAVSIRGEAASSQAYEAASTLMLEGANVPQPEQAMATSSRKQNYISLHRRTSLRAKKERR